MEPAICIVVGYGPGVGHGIARAFARTGASLLLVCRQPERHGALLAELRAQLQTQMHTSGADVRLQAADAGDPEALAAAIGVGLAAMPAQTGPVVLVYNAVVPTAAPPTALSPSQLAADLQVDVVGALAAVQEVLPLLRLRGGSLLFTGGGMAHHPVAPLASIGIGKAALRSLVLCLAQELADQSPAVGVGMVTIMGHVAVGTAFDPGVIGEAFVAYHQRLARAEPGPLEVLFQA
jgi:NAD(P)-dependent dehydrogenase (short-subunit alcohol dehydrogenase family)